MICWLEEYHVSNIDATPKVETKPGIALPDEPDIANMVFEEEVKDRNQFTKTADKLIVMQLVVQVGPKLQDKEVAARSVIDCKFNTRLNILWDFTVINKGQEWEKEAARRRFENGKK